MKELKGEELVKRYRCNYGIRDSQQVTEEMVRKHWNLERELAQLLLESTPENRWERFERSYTRLYAELDWLNTLVHSDGTISLDEKLRPWVELIGQPPKRIYEIGSGKGEMITHLANLGHVCRATEITRERGARFAGVTPNLSWSVSDGVHVNTVEPPDHYDVVLSDQVVEHFHPDDLVAHFSGVLAVLSKGGRYILSTPHRAIGPSDVSSVFGCALSMGMHLKEYTFRELEDGLMNVGFGAVRAVFQFPRRLQGLTRLLGSKSIPRPSGIYHRYLCVMERLPLMLLGFPFKNRLMPFFKIALFNGNIFIVAYK